MFRQDKRIRNREDMPSACTMFSAVLFIAGGMFPFPRVQSAELSVEVRRDLRMYDAKIRCIILTVREP